MAGRTFGPVGIIDIGSNSVRFVAYAGTPRVPSALFNEKVMAALGRGVGTDGRLDESAMELTLEALARFRLLGRAIGLKRCHTVATAAVRDAQNGAEFLRRVAQLGLKPVLLSGAEEAELAGLGVISAIPGANGVVADLGGGSLELIGVARGAAGAGVSLPLGVLRAPLPSDPLELAQQIKLHLKGGRLLDAARDRGLYLVGGSFRALAQLDLRSLGHPLPIVHEHCLTVGRIAVLRAMLQDQPAETLRKISGVSSTRLPNLPQALTILEALVRLLGPRKITLSAFGLREGLLYRDLDAATRAADPLLAGALEAGERLGRFGDHGALLDEWLAPLFRDDEQRHARLRLAACLLADIAWNAHPDFRAERAVDAAIHGNWVGIDAVGRALLGRTLSSAFGGPGGFSPALQTLLKPAQVARADCWGRAIRLGQRLSGGTEELLRRSSIELNVHQVVLRLPRRHAALYADAVAKRHRQLAAALGRECELELV